MEHRSKEVRNTRIMEHIITFLPGQIPGEERFGIEMAGITYPDSRYHIERENSWIHCLEYIIRGEGRIEMDGKIYYPKQGDVYLLAYGKNHNYRSDPDNPWEKIWMNVYGSLADHLIDSYGLRDAVLFPGCPIYPLFREFLDVCENGRRDSGRLAMRTTLIFHEILLRLAETRRAPKEEELPDSPAAKVKEYIDGHIYGKLSVAELTEVVNLSASQLTRVFGKAYGRTPYDYVLERKTDTACMLLGSTGMSVKEIAGRLNFSDEHYFSNVFKKRMGMPPGKYRERGQAGENR